MDARAITAALGGSWAGHYGLALWRQDTIAEGEG